jgi:hypothetical protein
MVNFRDGDGEGDFRTIGRRDAAAPPPIPGPRNVRKGRVRLGGSTIPRLPDVTSRTDDKTSSRDGDDEEEVSWGGKDGPPWAFEWWLLRNLPAVQARFGLATLCPPPILLPSVRKIVWYAGVICLDSKSNFYEGTMRAY